MEMTPDNIFETALKFGTAGFVALVLIVVFMELASMTPIGRAMLPSSDTKAVAKLLPQAWIADVVVKDAGCFEIDMKGANRLKTVHVRHREDATIAWTYDTEVSCPQSGTCSLSEFRHRLPANSAGEAEAERVRERIDAALKETLASRGFVPASEGSPDVLISAFAAIEDTVAVDTMTDSFERDDNREWKAAVRTAMKHDGVANPATIASGSLLIDVVDARTMRTLWRSATIGKIVVDASDIERERRTRLAVSEMLKAFPPPQSVHSERSHFQGTAG